jgi:ribosomal protein S7
VTTSGGATLVVPIARSKNRRAALASRWAETSTSMTWPNWSMARYT